HPHFFGARPGNGKRGAQRTVGPETHDARRRTVHAGKDVAASASASIGAPATAAARERERAAHETAQRRAPRDLARLGAKATPATAVGADGPATAARAPAPPVAARAEIGAPRERAGRRQCVRVVILRAEDARAVVGHGRRREDFLLRREPPRHVAALAYGVHLR